MPPTLARRVYALIFTLAAFPLALGLFGLGVLLAVLVVASHATAAPGVVPIGGALSLVLIVAGLAAPVLMFRAAERIERGPHAR